MLNKSIKFSRENRRNSLDDFLRFFYFFYDMFDYTYTMMMMDEVFENFLRSFFNYFIYRCVPLYQGVMPKLISE